MNAQKKLLGLGASILALGGVAAEGVNQVRKAREKQQKELFKKYKKALRSSKKGYEKEANIKQENKQIVNNIAKPEVGSFGIEALAGRQPEEKQVVENKKTDWGAELEALQPQQKQKFILSEEGATYPITAENSQTNIEVDEGVANLIEVRAKNAKRAAAGQKNAEKRTDLARLEAKKHNRSEIDYKKTNKFLEEFGFNKSSADYKSVGLDKYNLNSNSIKRGEDLEEMSDYIDSLFAQMAIKFKGNQAALDYLEEKRLSTQIEYGSAADSYYHGEANDSRSVSWTDFRDDIDQLVEDMQNKKYQEYADYMNGNYEDSEPTTPKYTVWQDPDEEETDYVDEHPEWEGKSRKEILDSFVF